MKDHSDAIRFAINHPEVSLGEFTEMFGLDKQEAEELYDLGQGVAVEREMLIAKALEGKDVSH